MHILPIRGRADPADHVTSIGIKLLMINVVVQCIGIDLLMISIVVQCIGINLNSDGGINT